MPAQIEVKLGGLKLKKKTVSLTCVDYSRRKASWIVFSFKSLLPIARFPSSQRAQGFAKEGKTEQADSFGNNYDLFNLEVLE